MNFFNATGWCGAAGFFAGCSADQEILWTSAAEPLAD